MAIQRVTIAKISGVAGQRIFDRVCAWVPMEAQADKDEARRPELMQQVTNFVEAFRSNAKGPPVLYFAEYMDQWSVAFSLLSLLGDSCSFTKVSSGGPSVAV